MQTKKIIKQVFLIMFSSFLQATSILVFIRPAELLPSGFTGLATILNIVFSRIDVSLYIILLNVPVALLCAKQISKKFVLLSLIQLSLNSLFLAILPFDKILDDILLNTLFGGAMYGIAVALSLKGGGSTGGTDFIALYISSKKGKSIFKYVFVFNCTLFVIFGVITDLYFAGYSIIMSFIVTKVINVMFNVYNQITFQITTSKADEIIKVYTEKYRHGISVISAKGGYSNKEMQLLHTVISETEAVEIAHLMREIDPNVIINSFKTEKFYGGFYRGSL